MRDLRLISPLKRINPLNGIMTNALGSALLIALRVLNVRAMTIALLTIDQAIGTCRRRRTCRCC